jgi:uncharacterized protein YjbJ (UPF0337 family)
MAKIKGAKDELAGKTKRLIGEVLGDQKLQDEGKEQERQGRDDVEKPTKPLGNLDQLT